MSGKGCGVVAIQMSAGAEGASAPSAEPPLERRAPERVSPRRDTSVPDRAPGKNKLHLDLNVGRDRIESEVARLTALGATEQYRIDEPGGSHTTMADPEGNLFCVQ